MFRVTAKTGGITRIRTEGVFLEIQAMPDRIPRTSCSSRFHIVSTPPSCNQWTFQAAFSIFSNLRHKPGRRETRNEGGGPNKDLRAAGGLCLTREETLCVRPLLLALRRNRVRVRSSLGLLSCSSPVVVHLVMPCHITQSLLLYLRLCSRAVRHLFFQRAGCTASQRFGKAEETQADTDGSRRSVHVRFKRERKAMLRSRNGLSELQMRRDTRFSGDDTFPDFRNKHSGVWRRLMRTDTNRKEWCGVYVTEESQALGRGHFFSLVSVGYCSKTCVSFPLIGKTCRNHATNRDWNSYGNSLSTQRTVPCMSGITMCPTFKIIFWIKNRSFLCRLFLKRNK